MVQNLAGFWAMQMTKHAQNSLINELNEADIISIFFDGATDSRVSEVEIIYWR